LSASRPFLEVGFAVYSRKFFSPRKRNKVRAAATCDYPARMQEIARAANCNFGPAG